MIMYDLNVSAEEVTEGMLYMRSAVARASGELGFPPSRQERSCLEMIKANEEFTHSIPLHLIPLQCMELPLPEIDGLQLIVAAGQAGDRLMENDLAPLWCMVGVHGDTEDDPYLHAVLLAVQRTAPDPRGNEESLWDVYDLAIKAPSSMFKRSDVYSMVGSVESLMNRWIFDGNTDDFGSVQIGIERETSLRFCGEVTSSVEQYAWLTND